MNLYLIIFSENYVGRDAMLAYLDTLDYIVTWRTDFLNSVYVKSEESAKTISQGIMARFGDGRHLVTEISMSEKFGYLPEKTWNFLKMEANKDFFIK